MSPVPLLRLEGIPVYQNRMFDDAASARACPSGDVVLVQDPRSGLVHNAAFDAARVVYDTDYQNEQGHSGAFRRHLDEVAATVGRFFAGRRILEIGCGKGVFLERLRGLGHDATGLDPAYEGDAPYILRETFAPGVGIRGEAIVLRHVLEHIDDPVAFLRSIRDANGGGGLVYVEVPCLDWILTRRAWFDFFYEHVNYFRLADFDRMFGRVLERGHGFDGQYLYVVADLATLRDPADPALGAPPPVRFPDDLFAGVERCVALARSGRPQVIWGAAAKGATYALELRRRGIDVAFAVDINPAKQGRFLAGSGLPVRAPAAIAALSSPPDVHVMNSNYIDEIRATGGPALRYLAVDQA